MIDANNREVAFIKQEIFVFLPQFEVYVNGMHAVTGPAGSVASISKALFTWGDKSAYLTPRMDKTAV